MASRPADPPGFALDATRADGGATTIAVSGELDLASADELRDAIREALEAGDVTIDLAKLTFMDSAGVRVLNTALRDAAGAGRALRVGPAIQPNVAQVLELTGMLGLLRAGGEPA